MVRQKETIALPEDYWIAIENRIDGVLIRSKGDAVITLLRELQQTKPDSLKFDEMINIKHKEFIELQNELSSIKTTLSKYKKIIDQINKLMGKDVLTLCNTDMDLAFRDIGEILTIWRTEIGFDGMMELRKIGFKKG